MTQSLQPRTAAQTDTRRRLASGAYVVALVAWSALIGIPNDPIGISLWIWLFTVCWRPSLPAREHLRFARDWAPWVLALAAYGLLRGLTDDLGFAPHLTAPIHADEWLARIWGGEVVPTVSLQKAWCGDPCLRDGPAGWWDVVVSTVYASHFVVGLTIAGVLWLRNRRTVAGVDPALRGHQLPGARRVHRLPDVAAVDGGSRRLAPGARPDLQPRLPRPRHRTHHHGLRRPGQQDGRDALPPRGDLVPGRLLRHQQAAHPLAVPADPLPARDVAGPGLLRRALPHRRGHGCGDRRAGHGHRLVVGPASAP